MLRPAQKQSAAEPESEAFLQPEPVREAAELPSVQLRLASAAAVRLWVFKFKLDGIFGLKFLNSAIALFTGVFA